MKEIFWKINDWMKTPEADRILGGLELLIGAMHIASGTKEFVSAQMRIESKEKK
ncbi:MAG: hypothetical protein K6C34_00875 [Alphaproteobacteria bacterium]|nr:hypothetical protein [Alphaproteobacteria bacterium]